MIDSPAVPSVVFLYLSGSPNDARQALEQDGLWVTVCHEVAQATHRIQSQRPNLLLIQLDGRRPEEWQACERVMSAGSQPSMVLVDDPSVEARLAALATGADDVLTRPFHPLELVARARSLLRRAAGEESAAAVLRHEDLELDLDGYEARLNGVPLMLTPVEYRLLRTLLESPHRTFTRDELLTQVHTFDDRLPSDRSIDLHVAELRRKLGDMAEAPRYVETVRSVGYRLAHSHRASGKPSGAGELSGRAALVMQGGSGLGRAIVEALAEAGASVTVLVQDEHDANGPFAELQRKGFQVEAAVCDDSQPDQIAASIAAAVERFGRLDILICNSGELISDIKQPVPNLRWEQQLTRSIGLPYHAASAALPHMLKRGWGRIINVVSIVPTAEELWKATCAAAKQGLAGFTKALAEEVGSRGVTVNTVLLGPNGTTDEEAGRTLKAGAGARPNGSSALREHIVEAELIARAVILLAADGAHGITAQAFDITGALLPG